MRNLGDFIAEKRHAKGLSQKTLAARACILPQNLSALERGRGGITFDTMVNLARGLEMRTSEFVAEYMEEER